MPRTADHAARRRQITSAVRELATNEGIGRVTIARSAAHAGISVGLVQHYYTTKEDLLADTLTSVLQDILDRVDAAIARSERRYARIEQMMDAAFQQLLPLDDSRRQEAYLRHAFAGLALDDQGLREHQRRFDDVIIERSVQGIRNGMHCGEVLPGTDALLEAQATLALVDGLAMRLLLSDRPADRRRARRAISARMATIFRGPCEREALKGTAEPD